MSEWNLLAEVLPAAKQAVLVKSEDWRLPRVLEFDEHPYPRLIDRMSGRFFWYPERMHWHALPLAPQVAGVMPEKE